KPGDLVGPVHTKYGWHIIKVLELRRFADIKEQVRSAAGPSVGQARLGAVLTETAKSVVVNPRFGRWDLGNGKVIPTKITADDPSIQFRDHTSTGVVDGATTDPSTQ
ncbi:MAG: PPIC-type domain, partial [Frankiaceae bacterium]|nr:PPIC-type domain [Frankiaceae bacterium]